MLKRNKQSGFNLLELMVVLTVASITISVGVPAFNGFVSSGRISTFANDIATSMHLARTESVKRRANISICPSTEWKEADPSCTNSGFEQGWIIFVDSVPPVAPDLAHNGRVDVLFSHGPVGDGVTLTTADQNAVIAGPQFMVFGTNGYPVNALGGNNAVFNFQFCDHRGDEDVGGGVAAGRWIQISPTGRPQIYRLRDQVESVVNPTNGC